MPDFGLLLPVLLAALGTGLVCWFAGPLGRFLGLLDDPSAKQHSRHQAVTPLVGGIAVLMPVLIFSLASHVTGAATMSEQFVLYPWIGQTVGVVMILGLLDDRFHLSAASRLIVTTLAFLVAVAAHPALQISQIDLPPRGLGFPLGWASIPFTVLCLVALANAVNMADGRNGLVAGMGLIWIAVLMPVTLALQSVGLVMLFVSLLVVFICNLRGRLFLGDGGTYGLAAFIGVTTIVAHRHAPEALTTTQVICLFLIPVLDMARVIASRISRGVSPLTADHEHLHHYLDDWLGWRWGLPIYLVLVAVPIAIAFARPNWGGEAIALGLALFLVTYNLARRGRRALSLFPTLLPVGKKVAKRI